MFGIIVTYWEEIFAFIGIVGAICSFIVKVFSGCKWASKIVKICDLMSVVNTAENKEKIEKATKNTKKK